MTIPVICAVVFVCFAAVAIVSQLREIFASASIKHPFVVSFAVFSFVVTAGEFLRARLSQKAWVAPSYLIARALFWGVIGVVAAAMIRIYSLGTAALLTSGFLPGGSGGLWSAVCASLFCTFMGTVFLMLLYIFTESAFELAAGGNRLSVRAIFAAAQTRCFASPLRVFLSLLFWMAVYIPIFMQPAEYQAALSALGFTVFVISFAIMERN